MKDEGLQSILEQGGDAAMPSTARSDARTKSANKKVHDFVQRVRAAQKEWVLDASATLA